MKRLLGFALAALSIHASSYADVMYQWTSVTNGTPTNVSMTLVFSDAAVAQGQLSYHVGPGRSGSSGLAYFAFGADRITPMSYTPATQQFGYGWGILDLNLQFNPDGYLTGSIYANDTNSDVTMGSVGNLFTISAMHSDQSPFGAGISCGSDPSCAWSTGILARVEPAGMATMASSLAAPAADAAQVPEPGTLALIGLGLLALGGGTWRKLADRRAAVRR